ncbi:unnamed protein product [marine sediment metagenome]|uniref:Uncharacterized protein n=1 Tax=marine sediment metagenome TaxID=412755 RepID=X1CTT6_9ZZZZ
MNKLFTIIVVFIFMLTFNNLLAQKIIRIEEGLNQIEAAYAEADSGDVSCL